MTSDNTPYRLTRALDSAVRRTSVADYLKESGIKTVASHGTVTVGDVTAWIHWYDDVSGTMEVTLSGTGRTMSQNIEISLLPSELEAWIEPLALLLVMLAGHYAYAWTSAAWDAQERS
jgi:hypothetical protein